MQAKNYLLALGILLINALSAAEERVKRAQAIYDYLVAAGIDAQRLTERGYGASRPLTLQDTPAGQQLNRRVAFKIIK